MSHDPAPNLYISGMYRKMIKNRTVDKPTREFLMNNVRNARWLIESIQQRKSTIMRVIRQVVDAQREFFDKGPEFLRPLPMIQVADQLGIHVATVSRAVSEKWIQTPRGVFPLRRFFSGGSSRKRDRRFGLIDNDFWHWWHRVGKTAAGYRDLATKAEAQNAYDEWIDLGKPRAK